MRPLARLCLIAGALLPLAISVAAADEVDDPIGAFEIRGFEITGDTQLGTTLIAHLLSPFTGKTRHFSDVQLAMQSLEDAYIAKGYSMARVTLP